MSFANSVANDYKIGDAQETVTFTAKRESGNTNYTITNADGGDLSNRTIAASNGLFQLGDWSFLLGANQITVAADQPREGDIITQAGGTVWVLIQDARLDALGISWNCIVRKAR